MLGKVLKIQFQDVMRFSIVLVNAMLFVAMLVICYWVLYPHNPSKVFSIDGCDGACVSTKVIEPGQTLEYTIGFEKYTDVDPGISVQLQNGLIFSLNEDKVISAGGAGDSGIFTTTAFIPESTPEGTYRLRVFLNYQVNPLLVVHREYVTEEFTVVRPQD